MENRRQKDEKRDARKCSSTGATVFVAGLMIPEALVEISAIAGID
jgi:hypothetical protein